jgi:hypothetical protein
LNTLGQIKKAFKFDKASFQKADSAFWAMSEQLKDDALRKRLVRDIPHIIRGLVIDTVNKSFSVISPAGIQSRFYKVSLVMQQSTARACKNSWTPERRAAVSAKLKGRKLSNETRRKMSLAQRRRAKAAAKK